MAWTAPSTWTTGTVVTAAQLNAQLRDNMKELWREVAYAQITSNATTAATTEGTATQIVSSGAVTYTAEPILIEFYCPYLANSDSGATTTLTLFDDTTVVGIIGKAQAAAGNAGHATHLMYRLTPTAASHTYLVKFHTSAGTSTANAGAGGSATYLPCFIRVTQRGS